MSLRLFMEVALSFDATYLKVNALEKIGLNSAKLRPATWQVLHNTLVTSCVNCAKINGNHHKLWKLRRLHEADTFLRSWSLLN